MSAIWKGHLQIKQVLIPIALQAVEASRQSSAQLQHVACHTKIKQRRFCPECKVDLQPHEIEKAWDSGDGFVTLSQDELATIQPASSKVIEITGFMKELDPLHVSHAYYVEAAGTQALHHLSVFHQALKTRIGIGRLCLRGKETQVAIQARTNGMVVFIIRSLARLREQAPPVQVKVERRDVSLFGRLIRSMLGAALDRDEPYEAALAALVASKGNGAGKAPEGRTRRQTPAVAFAQALTDSLKDAA